MRVVLAFLLIAFATVSASAQALPSIVSFTSNMERMDGYFPLYWDDASGRIWLEIPRFEEDFLYVVSQPAGLGSNDVGLDRNELGGERLVRFERVGPRILLTQPNLRFRASSDNPAEQASIRDAFAGSVVWGFTAEAATGDAVLVDATDFVVRDAHRVAKVLAETDQGTFDLDASRSTVFRSRTRAFPENTEMEARLTFTSDDPGPQVVAVAADPYAITLRVRHSFIRLPDDGFTPRRNDPRSGFNGISYSDPSVPIGAEIEQRFIARHRLEVDDRGDVVAPITYYLDPGTPEPVRSALLEGAGWWADAFAAAGLPGGFQVKMLPDDADPMDVRFNTIQWVHRATRGWSYGQTVIDPRTGEIIKGNVLLGSLRIRQDYLIAEGLLRPYVDDDDDPALLEIALARIRQLAAHEVGHTLGLRHNFAASADGRASVMDYPAPYATTDGERISLDDAYAVGIGPWDEVVIRYGYSVFPSAPEETAALSDILQDAWEAGLHFITDDDARPLGAAHPRAVLWDHGSDPIASLRREMRVRSVALQEFGLANLRSGRPLAALEEVFVPLYLRHRYQVEGTARAVGGIEYTYAVRDDARELPVAVPGDVQRAALEALLECVTPEALAVPANARRLIAPRPPGYERHRELFSGHTGVTFDPYAPAEAAAGIVFAAILAPERAARLVVQSDLDERLPDLLEVLDRVTDRVWKHSPPADAYRAGLARIAQHAWTDALIALAADADASPAVRARTRLHLRDLGAWLDEQPRTESDKEYAHRIQVRDELDRFLRGERPTDPPDGAPAIPPGSPIGG